tara:strand:+ start:2130 stop:2312 length:183 start_codon:yes stop_codon:yes gene_type:complete
MEKEIELKRDFQTTRSGGHSHVARLDNQGNGETTVVDRHKHLVRDFQIQQAGGHRHRVVR